MKLIVNTNRIMASLIKDSLSRRILKFPGLRFATIHFGEMEILKYRKDILSKAQISEEDFDKAKMVLLKNIEIISDSAIQNKMEEAKEIMDNTDRKDSPFIAAALAVNNDGIWSDDRHFEKQNRIKVWKTKDLLDYINK